MSCCRVKHILCFTLEHHITFMEMMICIHKSLLNTARLPASLNVFAVRGQAWVDFKILIDDRHFKVKWY